MKDTTVKLINKIIEIKDEDFLIENLNSIIENNTNNVLTIVANKGVHHLPTDFQRGYVYYASEGSLNFDNASTIKQEYEKILKDLSVLLQSKLWKSIYLIPYGHSTLSMQIKLLVYRITHIETIDVFYVGGGEYTDLSLKQRDILTGESNK